MNRRDPTPTIHNRSPEADIDALFLSRWSRRALSAAPIPPRELQSLFESARWAPSANNGQPWLFVYADDEDGLARLRALVIDRNRRWADRAPVLAVLFAQRHKPGTSEPSRTYAFDTGAAWMSLALRATQLGLSARAMGGVHLDLTYEACGVPRAEYEAMCVIAIGRPTSARELPEDLAAKELPSTRKPLAEVARRLV